MRIEDFTLDLIPGTDDVPCEIDKYWKPAADGSKIATGTRGGVKYQVKVRAAEPKWKNNAQAVAELENALRTTLDETEREKLERRIAAKRKKKEAEDLIDAIYDNFLTMKQSIIREVHNTGSRNLVIAEEAWKQPVSWLGNSVCYCEATLWQTVAVGDGKSCPLKYCDVYPTPESRYKVVAALAKSLSELHSVGIRHNDLKRPNTLILQKGDMPQVALIDFDAAFFLNEFVNHKYHAKLWNLMLGGTYFAPEMLKFSEGFSASDLFEEKDEFLANYDYKDITMASDIFSLGITIYEYLFDVEAPMFRFVKPGNDPVESNEYGTMLLEGYEIDFPDEVKNNPFLHSMMKWMLAVEPEDRPTAAQVYKAFTTLDIADISEKYAPEDFSAPWDEDGIEWVPEKISAANVDIKRIRGKVGLYRLTNKNGISVTRRKDRLIEDGYARAVGGGPTATAKENDANKLWDGDIGKTADVKLPACIVRSAMAGKYCLKSNLFNLFTFEQLRDKGFFCDDSEKYTLWPDDATKATINEPGRIARNFEKGIGEYLLFSKDGKTFEQFSFSRLLRAGHVSMKQTRQFCEPWTNDMEFVPENIPAGVESITRSLNIANLSDKTKYKYVENGTVIVVREVDLVKRGWMRKK